MIHSIASGAIPLATALPVAARITAQIPEANSITLFALGVAGVILGRQLSRKRSNRDD